jgi:hypothetical protein
MGDEPEVHPVTAEEEKQLRRVFELLCDYHNKKRIQDVINDHRLAANLKKVTIADLLEARTPQQWEAMDPSSAALDASNSHYVQGRLGLTSVCVLNN